MKKYLINNNSDTLLIFFTGWGCDEFEFEHHEAKSDVLLLYEYLNLDLDFDFSKYKKFNLLAFSAGVFVSSIFNFDKYNINNINKKIALDGNPYLFDECLGLSKEIQDLLYNITIETADEFAKNYLIKTPLEQKNFHNSKRSLESSKAEFDSLKKLYLNNKQNIKDIFDKVLFGEDDVIFNVSSQKEFYKERLHLVKDARHNMFFRIKSYEEIFDEL